MVGGTVAKQLGNGWLVVIVVSVGGLYRSEGIHFFWGEEFAIVQCFISE